MPVPPATYRLDLIPLLTLLEVINVGDISAGPFRDLAPTMYPTYRVRRQAQGMVNYHRLYNGAAIPNPTVISAVGGRLLDVNPSEAVGRRIARSIEAFRYVALLTNRTGHGPNSSHLHVESYGFRGGSGRYLTLRSRFTQVLGIKKHRQRAWAHLSPAWVPKGAFDRDLMDQLGSILRSDAKLARRLWRSLWWFNQAHHDDPYQPLEFSILCLATAFEALIRPSDKVRDLQRAVRSSIGSTEFDDWVKEFYGERSAITHGDEAWQPLFGQTAHIDHYRIATRLFPVLVEHRLVELRKRPAPHPLVASMVRGDLARLLTSDEALIARLEGVPFGALKLRRNLPLQLEVKFLPVRLNHEDRSTRSARYADLIAWLRRIAIAACRSAASRWKTERRQFDALRRQFAAGIPDIGGAHVIPVGVDDDDFFDELAKKPEQRLVLGTISLADLADSMEAAESRRQFALLRET